MVYKHFFFFSPFAGQSETTYSPDLFELPDLPLDMSHDEKSLHEQQLLVFNCYNNYDVAIIVTIVWSVGEVIIMAAVKQRIANTLNDM